jgi:hypothetical protein
MKKYIFTIISTWLLLSACGQPIAYIGDSFKPTATVDVFYSVHDIKRDYKVIGHIKSQYYAQNSAKKKLIKFAKEAGADAIVFLEIDTTKANKSNRVNADLVKYN